MLAQYLTAWLSVTVLPGSRDARPDNHELGLQARAGDLWRYLLGLERPPTKEAAPGWSWGSWEAHSTPNLPPPQC